VAQVRVGESARARFAAAKRRLRAGVDRSTAAFRRVQWSAASEGAWQQSYGRVLRSSSRQSATAPILTAAPIHPRPTPNPQALFDLEATNTELKADLRDLFITGAKEIDVQGGSRKAIIVQVRARQRAVSGLHGRRSKQRGGAWCSSAGGFGFSSRVAVLKQGSAGAER